MQRFGHRTKPELGTQAKPWRLAPDKHIDIETRNGGKS
jgi:hypothetical protein